MKNARATSTKEPSPNLGEAWSPPSIDDWLSLLRSATLARDLCRWTEGEMRAPGIASDLAAVTHLSDCFEDAVRELDQAADLIAEAQKRLLTVATETPPNPTLGAENSGRT